MEIAGRRKASYGSTAAKIPRCPVTLVPRDYWIPFDGPSRVVPFSLSPPPPLNAGTSPFKNFVDSGWR
jgi:hypothetical protein